MKLPRPDLIFAAATIVLAGWGGWSCYAKGKAEGALAVHKEEAKKVAAEIASVRAEIGTLVTANAHLREEVAQAKARVVVVDKIETQNIDSALAKLRRSADSGTKALIEQVVSGYEKRLVARDDQIAQLETQVGGLERTVAAQQKMINLQDNLDRIKDDMLKDLRRAMKPRFGLELAKAAIVGGLAFIGSNLSAR